MGLMTLFGTAMVCSGLLTVSQLDDHTFAQAWNRLWEVHPLFAWVAVLYCFVMVACDLWVISCVLFEAPGKNLAHRSHP